MKLLLRSSLVGSVGKDAATHDPGVHSNQTLTDDTRTRIESNTAIDSTTTGGNDEPGQDK